MLGGGVVIGSAIGISAALVPKLQKSHIFDLTAGISVAILAVVIATFAILVAFMTDDYSLIVKEALGSPQAAFELTRPHLRGRNRVRPSFASVSGIFLWPIATEIVESRVDEAVARRVTAWSVVGDHTMPLG